MSSDGHQDFAHEVAGLTGATTVDSVPTLKGTPR